MVGKSFSGIVGSWDLQRTICGLSYKDNKPMSQFYGWQTW
jgi:hypothetical protein